MKFASFDVEMANRSNPSICAIGVAIFDRDKLKASYRWLVRPPKGFGFFCPEFIEIHGITWFDVQHEPEFPAIAPQLFDCFRKVDCVIAHNAGFDMTKLRGTVNHFGIDCPEFDYLCSCRLAKNIWPEHSSHGLAALAKHINHKFHHHDAQCDAEAAGHLLVALMKSVQARNIRQLSKATGISPAQFVA